MLPDHVPIRVDTTRIIRIGFGYRPDVSGRRPARRREGRAFGIACGAWPAGIHLWQGKDSNTKDVKDHGGPRRFNGMPGRANAANIARRIDFRSASSWSSADLHVLRVKILVKFKHTRTSVRLASRQRQTLRSRLTVRLPNNWDR